MIDNEWKEVYVTVIAAIASLITFFLQYWSDTPDKKDKILGVIAAAVVLLLLVFIPGNKIETSDPESDIKLGDAFILVPENWKYSQKKYNTWILTNEEIEGTEIYLSYNKERLMENLIDCKSTDVLENTQNSEDFFITVNGIDKNYKYRGSEYEVTEDGAVEKYCYTAEFERDGDKYRVYGKSEEEYQIETKSAIQDIKFVFK